jgi:hypothetical protein
MSAWALSYTLNHYFTKYRRYQPLKLVFSAKFETAMPTQTQGPLTALLAVVSLTTNNSECYIVAEQWVVCVKLYNTFHVFCQQSKISYILASPETNESVKANAVSKALNLLRQITYIIKWKFAIWSYLITCEFYLTCGRTQSNMLFRYLHIAVGL